MSSLSRMKEEKAQPQTVLASDGFPIENLKFCGGGQEVMAVIQGNKPVAVNTFDRGYVPMDFSSSFQAEEHNFPMFHKCAMYSYEEIYKASQSVSLLRFNSGTFDGVSTYYYFLRKDMKMAYLLSLLWGETAISFQEKYNLNYDEANILVGLVLGYKKKDILSWFLMELQETFKMSFDNLDEREKIITNPKIIKRKGELKSIFESNWKSATQKFKQIQEELVVPEGWKKKLTQLPSPRAQTRRKRKGSL